MTLTRAQRCVLRELSGWHLFPGYCELMLQTGLKSFKSVDWVLEALERRKLVERDSEGDFVVTDSGREVLKS
jgi:hypothetical protein